jgi:Integrase zinc binding domain
MKSQGQSLVRSDEWVEGTPPIPGKVYVPGSQITLSYCFAHHHDTLVARHPGRRWKTLELVSHNYWWPQMSCYVGLYIKTCDPCMRTKIRYCQPICDLHPLAIPNEWWDTILNVVDLVSTSSPPALSQPRAQPTSSIAIYGATMASLTVWFLT